MHNWNPLPEISAFSLRLLDTLALQAARTWSTDCVAMYHAIIEMRLERFDSLRSPKIGNSDPDQEAEMTTGRCECGSVRYEIDGSLPGATLCHCGQCRRQGGHAQAWITLPRERVSIDDGGHLSWYRSSNTGERGFCRRCGSSVFSRFDGEGDLYVPAGSMDAP